MTYAQNPKYPYQIVPAATPAKVGATGERRLMRIILTAIAGANAIVEFKNAATDTGDVLLTLETLAETTLDVDLTNIGGIDFSTAMFCKPVGAGAICYVWYE